MNKQQTNTEKEQGVYTLCLTNQEEKEIKTRINKIKRLLGYDLHDSSILNVILDQEIKRLTRSLK